MYNHINSRWQQIWKDKPWDIRSRLMEWRRQPTIIKIERPTRLDKARSYGYKAKQGFIVVRIKVGRGGMRKSRPKAGRRQKHLGVVRIKAAIGMQQVAEKRVLEKYPNLRVLNSYLAYKDGKYLWYEVIMIEPSHPAVKSDRTASKALGLVTKN